MREGVYTKKVHRSELALHREEKNINKRKRFQGLR